MSDLAMILNYGRDVRATSAAVEAYGIGRGAACIYRDFWSVSRRRGDRRSLPSSAVLPWKMTPCGREIADLPRSEVGTRLRQAYIFSASGRTGVNGSSSIEVST